MLRKIIFNHKIGTRLPKNRILENIKSHFRNLGTKIVSYCATRTFDTISSCAFNVPIAENRSKISNIFFINIFLKTIKSELKLSVAKVVRITQISNK